MGKSAENELVKLNAAFWNNCGVGVILGGVFVPLLGVYQKLPAAPRASEVFGGTLAVIVAMTIGGYMLHLAREEIKKILD